MTYMKQDTAEYNAYMADYMTRRYHKRRLQAIEYLGGACSHCHATTNLEIDHVDPTSKSFDIGKALSGWGGERILVELDKCQALCESCHELKTRKDNSVTLGVREFWEHGTLAGRRTGCKCAPCKSAQAKYMKEYRSKNK